MAEESKGNPDEEFMAQSLVDFYFSHVVDDSWCLGSENLVSTIESYRPKRKPIPLPRGSIMDNDDVMHQLCRIHDQKKEYDRTQLEKKQLAVAEHNKRMYELRYEEEKRRLAIREINRKKQSEIAEKNALELIQEEEEAKLKAKLKAVKKKEKQLGKKLSKLESKQTKLETKPQHSKKFSSDLKKSTGNVCHGVEQLTLNDDVDDQENLEKNSAFVSKAIKKVEKLPVINNKPKSKAVQETKDIEPIIKKASDLFDNKEYKEAIPLFSEAIILDPTNVDLLLKRCSAYFEIAKYKKSLRDADRSLKVLPFNPEGYYWLGEAHSALQNYSEADAAFSRLVTNSTYQSEVREKLFSLRIKQLEEMGYKSNEAFTALLKSENKTLDEAIDFLTSLQNGTAPTDDIYYSDEDDSDLEFESSEEEEEEEEENEEIDTPEENKENNKEVENIFRPRIVISKKSALLTDPSNPFQCCSLFVVGMKPDITSQEVQDVFAKFGDISSIKLSTDVKVYAFVNYIEWQSAGQAMEALQGSRWLLSTIKPLTIKYPVNVVNEMIPRMKCVDTILNKLKAEKEEKHTRFRYRPQPVKTGHGRPGGVRPAIKKPGGEPKPVDYRGMIDHEAPSKYPVVQHVSTGKPRPSPKTEECYYWRTTGCTFGKKCFNLHIPNHRGIALRGTHNQSSEDK